MHVQHQFINKLCILIVLFKTKFLKTGEYLYLIKIMFRCNNQSLQFNIQNTFKSNYYGEQLFKYHIQMYYVVKSTNYSSEQYKLKYLDFLKIILIKMNAKKRIECQGSQQNEQNSQKNNYLKNQHNPQQCQHSENKPIYTDHIKKQFFSQDNQHNHNFIMIPQQIQTLMKQYYDFFRQVIPNPQNYIPQKPSEEDFKKHKIKYLAGNQFYEKLQSFREPFVRVKYAQKKGSIVVYTVIVSMFQLQINLINIDRDGPIKNQNIGQGSYGIVRIQQQNNRMFVVKRQIFEKNYHLKQFEMSANKYQIEQIILELAIYKICSLYKIGPAVQTKIGFDLICYKNCIEFQIELCSKIKFDNKIYVNKNKFEKQIKECLLVLHLFRIIHKDIKPENILFSRQYHKYVIADFGLSHPIQQKVGQVTQTYRQGTQYYMSPQMKNLKSKGYIHLYGNDIYSFKKILNQTQNSELQEGLEKMNSYIKNKIKASSFEYEYLKLKYYCIKLDSNMDEVQKYWKYMYKYKKENEFIQLIELIEKSMDYKKIKSVYEYLSNQKIFKDYNLEKLKIQSQSILQLNINPQFSQISQLTLKNILRIYGFSKQVKDMIIKLQLQHKYEWTLAKIDKLLPQIQKINLNIRDQMLDNNVKYIKKIKEELSKCEMQGNKKGVFSNCMLLVKFCDNIIEIDEIHEKLKSLRNIEKSKQQRIEEEIIINYKFRKFQQFKMFQSHMKEIDQQRDNIIDKLQLNILVGSIYQHYANYQLAIIFFNRSLNINLKKYGECSINVAKTRNRIGLVYQDLNKYTEALNQFNQALKIYIFFYGQYHSMVGTIYNNIGIAYISLRKQQLALSNLFKSLNILIPFHGQKHQKIAKTYNNIGTVFGKINQQKKALQYFKKCQKIQVQLYDGINLVITYKNIGQIYLLMKQFQHSLQYYNKSLYLQKIFLGNQHPNLAQLYEKIGTIFLILEKYDDVLFYLIKSLEILEKYNDQINPVICRIYGYIGVTLFKQRRNQNSLYYLNKSLNISVQLNEQQNIGVIQIYRLIGQIYLSMKQYQMAISYFQRCQAIHKKISIQNNQKIALVYQFLGVAQGIENHQIYRIARIYQCLGVAYLCIENHQISLYYFEMAMNSYFSIQGQEKFRNFQFYFMISINYTELKNYEMALKFLQKSTNIQVSLMGQNHLKIADNYNQMGQISQRLMNYQFALKCFTKSFNIIDSIGKEINQMLYYRMAEANYQLNNFKQARLLCYQSFKKTQTNSQNDNRPLMIRNYKLMAKICYSTRQVNKSIRIMKIGFENFMKFTPLNCFQSIDFLLSLGYQYFKLQKHILTYYFYKLALKLLLKYDPHNDVELPNSYNMINFIQTIILPQLVHQYTDNNQYVAQIKIKYSKMGKNMLLKSLSARKKQLNFQSYYRIKNMQYLKCLIEIFLCYKYLHYLKQEQKAFEQIIEELETLQAQQQSEQIYMFVTLAAEIR